MISDEYGNPDFKAYMKREGFKTREEALDSIYPKLISDPYDGKHPSLVEKTIHESRVSGTHSITRRVE